MCGKRQKFRIERNCEISECVWVGKGYVVGDRGIEIYEALFNFMLKCTRTHGELCESFYSIFIERVDNYIFFRAG